MRRSWRKNIRRCATTMVVGACVLVAWPLAAAEEPCEQFLKLLKKQGYYDTAIDYLEAMRTSPLAPKSFVELLDWEIGTALVESTVQLPVSDRERRLNEARTYFEKFLADHAKHPRALTASVSLGNLLVERGKIKMDLAVSGKRSADQKNTLIRDARMLFLEAKELFAVIETELSDALRIYRDVDPNDVQRIADRDVLRTDLLQTRHALVKIVYEIAKTYEPGTKEYNEGLKQAAQQFGDLYKKYSRWVGGYYARIDEARCYQDLGEYAKTLEILGDMMTQPESDDSLRRMKSAATKLAMQTAVLPDVKRYEDALRMYRSWEKNIAKRGEATEDALAVKCLAAEAALELGRNMKASDPQSSRSRYDLLQTAKNLAAFSSQYPSEYQRKARLLLADQLLGGQVKVTPAKTFDEARDRSRIACDRLQEQNLSIEEESQLQAEAIENLRLALAVAPRDFSLVDRNVMRYSLAYLYWLRGDYYDAAVLGEYLAQRYPDCAQAVDGAKLALSSYLKLLENAPDGEDTRFERRRMLDLAQAIPLRWPDSAAADEARMILIRDAVRRRDLPKMLELLDCISIDSPRRGDTEIMTGQTLWASYVANLRRPESERLSKDELNKIFVQANKTLEDGVSRTRKALEAGGEPTPNLAAATLSLAQICLDAGMIDKAIEWLDDPKIGPHTLTLNANPITDRGNYRAETLKTTLRAYIAAHLFDKTEQAMNEYEKLADREECLRVYAGIGRQLEESLHEASRKGDRQICAKIAEGMALILSRITARSPGETDFGTLVWAAEMYREIGASLDSGDPKNSAESLPYYKKAVAVYRQLIEACRANERYAPNPKALQGVQIDLARCQRSLGNYAAAAATLVEVLKVQNNLVDAQREAAYVYQAWGGEKPSQYLLAIKGAHEAKNRKGDAILLVWGWGGIARRVQSNEDYQDLYHEARYNLALCREKYALSRPGRERIEMLEQAERDILVVAMLFPSMGGEKWRAQYDALLKEIQKYLGQREDGLKGLQQPAGAGKS